MRIAAALFCFSPRRCPSAHDSFTLKGSRVAAKGRSSFVFSNVPHCIAFAGSSKVVELCKMKFRASPIRKLGKEVAYILSFPSLFMRGKNGEIVSRLRFVSDDFESSEEFRNLVVDCDL